MDYETLEALNASIAKWERNADAKAPHEVKTGAHDCPLCLLFIKSGCVGCPVAEAADDNYCERTPYYLACDALRDWDKDEATREEFRLQALAEVAFLKSLLPSSNGGDE